MMNPEDTENVDVEESIELRRGHHYTTCAPVASSHGVGEEKQELVGPSLKNSQNETSGANLNNSPRHSESADANALPRDEKSFVTTPSDSSGVLAIPARTISTIGTKHFGNSLDTNFSIQPTSVYGPLADNSRQQFSQNQNPVTQQQPERVNMEGSRQPSVTTLAQQQLGQGGAPPLKTRPGKDYTSLQHSDNIPEQKDDNQGKKKVFILHSVKEDSDALCLFAATLRDHGVNVSIDLFEHDKSSDNWSMWYEREILSASVVLCIITPDFYKSITEHERIKGYAVYNLMSDPTKDIAFRAVFLDTKKNMGYVPLSMRGATCYCISTGCLNTEDEEFTSLYAFLTGQNRIEKPKLGKVIKLAPKKSRCKFNVCYHNHSSVAMIK